MLQSFKNHINQNLSFLKESKLLIAISGGLDSVVLTHVCHELKWNMALAHCNFNLRGDESEADENFVLQLADDLSLEVFIESFETETYAKANKLSIQMAARELRYSFFQELAAQLKFDYILTAHHADDNLETFLINLSRGTGLEGLSGIPEINNDIVRPLLLFSRDDIEAYAKTHNLKWREDSSNLSTKYLRNKLRHEVIPKLKETNPEFLKNFNATQQHLNDSHELIKDRIEDVSKHIVKTISKTEIHFNIAKLQKLNNPKAYLYKLLKDYKFTEWQDVYDLMDVQSGKQLFSQTHRLLKDREHLVLIEIVSDENNETIHISEYNEKIETSLGMLYIETATQINNSSTSTIYVDKDLLKFPLQVRQWRKGDYFYPFGMQGKKKLSKFFKDEKLSIFEKEQIWLLCSQNNIVWIINKRLDDRFKITERTDQILKISLL
jgi:tRNA(Ile)-lysidine synthase